MNKFPKVKTLYSSDSLYPKNVVSNHPVLLVQYSENSNLEYFCGHSWCTGCSLPALILRRKGYEMKAYSSMTAQGMVKLESKLARRKSRSSSRIW